MTGLLRYARNDVGAEYSRNACIPIAEENQSCACAVTILSAIYFLLLQSYDTSIIENTMTNSATVSPTPSTMR